MIFETQPSQGADFTYRDPGGPAQDLYTVVPSPRNRSLVSGVRIDVGPGKDILTLCEVEAFGDCPFGTYGFGCSKQCSMGCAGSDHACDQFDGRCDSCRPGYVGKYCNQKTLAGEQRVVGVVAASTDDTVQTRLSYDVEIQLVPVSRSGMPSGHSMVGLCGKECVCGP
ncbi:scavenger receptor class F member 2 [Elysia marginata]|uniref:Scavenger receptor class F member 2 n=1 Tax=Elysia marginata TaxID=1093978 RepID=A0AAV4G2S2_9GAST|nr:scavenger receptor class F member 2 [Elysia marginata]